jgi:hypothetical protein
VVLGYHKGVFRFTAACELLLRTTLLLTSLAQVAKTTHGTILATFDVEKSTRLAPPFRVANRTHAGQLN